MRLIRDESGQALVLAAVGVPVIILLIGLCVDVGNIRYVKRNLQAAADAAALAAAIEVRTCGGTANCTAMQTAAQDALTENGLNGSTLVTNCASTPVTGLQIMVNNPACSLGAADPNNGKGSYVEVVVSNVQKTYFAKLIGWDNVPVSARAEAARAGGASCIFALDPNGAGAIQVQAGIVNASCGIMDESSSTNALVCPLLGSVTATQINVVGGVSASLLGLGLPVSLCPMSPTARQGVAVPNPADPLAYLPTPALPACGTSTKSPYHGASTTLNINGPATLYPDGAYCGGINLNIGANVTFQPGTYILSSSKGAGGMSINLGATASGTDVTFYNQGPNGGIVFGLPLILFGSTTLTAPTTGQYAGILFMQSPQNTTAATILGGTSLNTQLTGGFYFPQATVNYAVSATSGYNILVAKDIMFLASIGLTNLTSVVTSDYSTLVNGSPVAGTGAVLVQ